MKNNQNDTSASRPAGKSLRPDVVVLGAGIMGSCLALELARRGRSVDLIDRAAAPMTAASLHNEGKLHLGFVYANDPHGETHGIMLRGSLAFARIVGELCGCGPDAFLPSEQFHYFVPKDSQLDMAAIEKHFHAVEEVARELTRNSGDLYLGLRTGSFYERNSAAYHASLFAPEMTLGSFRTVERSVSPAAVAGLLCCAIQNQPNIRFIGSTEVCAVQRLSGGEVEVELRREGTTFLNRYAGAANCLWDDKLRIDGTAGISVPGPWLLRYKATITIATQAAAVRGIPSATGILGTYGDVVNFRNGSYYLSWYPLCKIAQASGSDGRSLHAMVHNGIAPRVIKTMLSGFPPLAGLVSSITHRRFIRDNLREMAVYIPALAGLLRHGTSARLGGGVIVAKGTTDIDDPQSHLHQRSSIGPEAHGSYVTVNTGKYCTAPLFALQAADMIEEIL